MGASRCRRRVALSLHRRRVLRHGLYSAGGPGRKSPVSKPRAFRSDRAHRARRDCRRRQSTHLRTRDFNYMVFVEQDKKDKQLYLDESGTAGRGSMSSPRRWQLSAWLASVSTFSSPALLKRLRSSVKAWGSGGAKRLGSCTSRKNRASGRFLRLWQTKIRRWKFR